MHKHLVKLENLGQSDKLLLKYHLTVIDSLLEDQDDLALAIYGKKISKEYWDYRLRAAEIHEQDKEGIRTDKVVAAEVLNRLTVMFLCVQYLERSKMLQIPTYGKVK